MKKIGRNAPCPCGSGLKYKRCCEEKDLLGSLDRSTARATLETVLSDSVYAGVLLGVWSAFHPDSGVPPELDVLEDFYYDLYGDDLDRLTLDELILPLPEKIFAELPFQPETDESVIDVATETEPASPPNKQTELFPAPDSTTDSSPTP